MHSPEHVQLVPDLPISSALIPPIENLTTIDLSSPKNKANTPKMYHKISKKKMTDDNQLQEQLISTSKHNTYQSHIIEIEPHQSLINNKACDDDMQSSKQSSLLKSRTNSNENKSIIYTFNEENTNNILQRKYKKNSILDLRIIPHKLSMVNESSYAHEYISSSNSTENENGKRFWSYLSFCNCYHYNRIPVDFDGKNMICCNRHLIGGPCTQYCTVLFTFMLISFPLGMFYWLNYQLYILRTDHILGYIFIVLFGAPFSFFSLYFLFKTNLTDPGIIPRCTAAKPMHGPLNEFDRFCSTCHIIRATRAKHCAICDNCVNEFDHHCPWVGTCVARRNIRYFIGFVSVSGIHSVMIAIICLVNLFVFGFKFSGLQLIDIILLIYSSCIACMLVGMSGDYFFMIGNKLTMNEKIKYGQRVITTAEKKCENDSGTSAKRVRFKENLCQTFCYPLPPSQIFIDPH